MKIQLHDKLILGAIFAFFLYLVWGVFTYQEVPSRTGYERIKVDYGPKTTGQ